MVVNEALYYGKKLNHSLVNPNQLRCYWKMAWDNTFGQNRDLCLDTCEENTINLIPDCVKIGFRSYVPTEEVLSTLPHIEVIFGSEWNPNTFKISKVSTNNNRNTFHSQQHTFGYPTMDKGDYLYSDNGMDKTVVHSMNL